MAFTDLPLVGLLKTRMQWHQARQEVLANNVANADTPGFRPSDLEPMRAGQAFASKGLAPVAAARTHQAHLKSAAMAGGDGFTAAKRPGWEVTPAGNAVVLEEQMIEVSENQFDYRMASTLYRRSLGLLKTALGRGGI